MMLLPRYLEISGSLRPNRSTPRMAITSSSIGPRPKMLKANKGLMAFLTHKGLANRVKGPAGGDPTNRLAAVRLWQVYQPVNTRFKKNRSRALHAALGRVRGGG